MGDLAGTSGTKEISKKWPIISGIEANSKHEGRKINLEYQEATIVRKRDKVGL